MLTLLSLVIINNFSDYNGCYGKLYKIEQEYSMTLIKDVVCPDGSKYEYIVGIPARYLSPFN